MTSRARALRLLPLLLLPLSVAALASAAPTRDDLTAAVAAGQAAGKDFSGVVAPGLAVTGKDLTAIKLSGADLRGAILQNVNLNQAALGRASLRGAVLDRVSFIDADLSGCDLSGTTLKLVNLDGANLTDCDFTGAKLEQALLTSGGGTHLPALRLALSKATGAQFSRACVAGLSGDAFAFCYNTENPIFWPGTPFTVSPLLAAPAILGLEAKLRNDYFADQLLMDEKACAKGIQMLPVHLPDDPGLLQGRPLWAVLAGRETADKRTYFALVVPPFGPQTYRSQDLLTIWQGPWENLEAAGGLQVVRKPLLTITPKTVLPTPEEQAKAILRQAATIILDKRTYGPLVPGAAGLAKAATELRAAGQNSDLEAAKRLTPWQDFPRQCLLGSGADACAFLTEALPSLTGDNKQAAQDALAFYQAALKPLADDWPGLEVAGDAMTKQDCNRYLKAADLVGSLAAAEQKAAEAFLRVK